MKKIIKTSSFLLAFMCFTLNMNAQKFGYVNSQELLFMLNDVKVMQSNLEDLQKQLQKKGQQMLTAYQTQEQDAMAKKERGELSPVQEETVLKDLQAKQAELMTFEKEMQQKLIDKEKVLLEPILKKVNDAISSVATQEGYQLIFDTSTGVLLYADETQDVSSLVKAKLGI